MSEKQQILLYTFPAQAFLDFNLAVVEVFLDVGLNVKMLKCSQSPISWFQNLNQGTCSLWVFGGQQLHFTIVTF